MGGGPTALGRHTVSPGYEEGTPGIHPASHCEHSSPQLLRAENTDPGAWEQFLGRGSVAMVLFLPGFDWLHSRRAVEVSLSPYLRASHLSPITLFPAGWLSASDMCICVSR